MKYGYLGASFDPPTAAHMHLAVNLAEIYGLDKVLLGPCSNHRPDKKMKTDDVHRLNMLKLAINGNPLFEIDVYEMEQEYSKVFSYFTMEHLKKKYPEVEFYFLMGADLLISVGKDNWDYGEEFVENNKFLVTSREGRDLEKIVNFYPLLQKHKRRFTLFQQREDINISSTYIRREVSQGRNVEYLLPQGVYSYIKKNGLYKEVKK